MEKLKVDDSERTILFSVGVDLGPNLFCINFTEKGTNFCKNNLKRWAQKILKRNLPKQNEKKIFIPLVFFLSAT